MSLPKPKGLIPVAIEAASPPLEPPGVNALFQGLNVLPLNGLSVSRRMPISGKLVLPIGIAPAPSMRSTMGAFLGGIDSAKRGTPLVVGVPIKSMFSFIVKGTPWKGLFLSSSPAESASSASLRADSSKVRVIALMPGFTSFILLKWASTISLLEASLERTNFASSDALFLHNLSIINFLLLTILM